jgi:type V secretory pathway adhesin AidA
MSIEAMKQEPVAPQLQRILREDGFLTNGQAWVLAEKIAARYTTPPAAQRQWAGLTDEEIKIIWSWEVGKAGYNSHELPWRYARAIEAKLRDKNGGQA